MTTIKQRLFLKVDSMLFSSQKLTISNHLAWDPNLLATRTYYNLEFRISTVAPEMEIGCFGILISDW